MSLIVEAAALVTGRLWTRYENHCADPAKTQNQLLLDIIQRNRATAFGKDHGFAAIGNLADYRKQVAVGDYERLRSYVERAANGEAQVLTEKPVQLFTLTSGSTGAPKMIPVTETCRANHRQLTRLWYYRAHLDHPGLFGGKMLGVVSPAEEGKTAGNIPFGSASGLIYQSSPRWIKDAFALPYEVAEIKDFPAKYYVIMRLALAQEVTFIGTPNPSTILRLVEVADNNKYEIIRDIRDGTISEYWHIPADVRQKLEAHLQTNPARAAALEQLANQYGALRPKDYWPRLQLIGCWKGGAVGVRLNDLPRWFGESLPVRDLGYMASEAQMTLPISDSGCAGILDVSANFYEFIPESEIASRQPETLTCAELKEGESYYLLLTTPGGLYRYDINDVVRVAGFFRQTPLLEFIRKGRDVTNITGEKLHVNQVIQAMAQAQIAANIAPRHYRGFADAQESRYAFMVEFDGTHPHEASLKRLLAALERNLCQLNIEYAQKRASERLKPPVLCVMEPGWYERKASAALGSGGRDTQFKGRLLSTTPEEAGNITAVIELGEPSSHGSD
jgi:hypothetical protein